MSKMKIVKVEDIDDNNWEETGKAVYSANWAYVRVESEGLKFTVAVPFVLAEMFVEQCNVAANREVTVNLDEVELSDEDAKRPELERWDKMVDFSMLEKAVEEAMK